MPNMCMAVHDLMLLLVAYSGGVFGQHITLFSKLSAETTLPVAHRFNLTKLIRIFLEQADPMINYTMIIWTHLLPLLKLLQQTERAGHWDRHLVQTYARRKRGYDSSQLPTKRMRCRCSCRCCLLSEVLKSFQTTTCLPEPACLLVY